MSAKLDFVEFIINIISKNNNKAEVVSLFKDNTFLFIYNIRKTMSGESSDSSYFDVTNFWSNIKIIIEIQIYLQNFKPKNKSG